MRGITKAAALLLALALAKASFLSPHEPRPDSRTPLAVVDFDVPTGRHDVESLALKVDVEESEDICGETDLSINMKKLTYNEHGSGSGDVRVGDKTITAHWLLSCVMTHTEPEAQLLRFAIDKIDGHAVDVSELLLTFRKTAPALVLDAHYALEKSRQGKGKGMGHHHGQHDGARPDLDDELEPQIQELELLRA
ncbi:hypothetical protein B0T10DRAFT_581100 [Thelonectria olida]|uniref:Uncharacterized protein n=1 Tax=Thelonectria olida TaxID=1576542 RepID=A0A9P8VZZ0_9HYPO|nr:hypothetical protein B0T10DRAFT_581100 [Thelonectria olida]